MPPVEEVKTDPQDAPMRSSIIGIIYPPPEVRNIVDKTASFVARNGIEFENRIRQNEINNPKFNFLGTADPYHAYYQHKVKEFKEGKGQEPSAAKTGSGLGIAPQQKAQQEQLKIIEPVVPKEPPPEFEFIADPPSISAFDLDVVRLTAQFVARNGRGFLTNLMNREQRNYQFDFLRPQHSLFNYFTKLVEQYTKILIPPKGLMGKLRKEVDNPLSVLDSVKYRVDWAKHQERQKQKEEEEKEKERVAYAQIDWHDFVVVETVDFLASETGNLPPPTTPDEVGARMLIQERYEEIGEEPDAQAVEMEVESGDEDDRAQGATGSDDESGADRKRKPKRRGGADTTVQDMEESGSESDEDEDEPPEVQMRAPPAQMPPQMRDKGRQPPMPPMPPVPPAPKDSPMPPPLPPTPDQVIIKPYNPKAAKPSESDMSGYVISPLTGEKMPANKIQEHIKIGLLDPKWTEVRDKANAEKREQEEVLAVGTSIDSSLKNLAARRSDIFGHGEETQIGKMVGEEEEGKKNEKIVWDGHTASMEKVSQKARENISIEQQTATIHKTLGMVPDEEKDRIGPGRIMGGPQKLNMPPQPPSGLPPQQQKNMPPAPPQMPQRNQPPVSKPPAAPPQPPQKITPAPPVMPRPPQGGIIPPRPPPPGGMMVMPPQPPMMAPVVAMPPRGPMPPHHHPHHHHPHHMMQQGGVRPPQPPMPPMPTGGQGPPRGMPQPPQPMKHPAPQGGGIKSGGAGQGGDEPPAKKAKTEDQLMPEGQFLLKHPEGQVTFRVAVPSLADKPEWKCNGQSVNLTLPLTDTVSVIKAKINEMISMPVGKQKLQFEGMFIKDSNSLAFYNLTRNCVITLQLKERGGRKK